MNIAELGYIIICLLIIVGGSGLIIMYMHGICKSYKREEKRNVRRDKEENKGDEE